MEISSASIQLSDLKNLLKNTHQIVIIDVRSREEFEEKHIPNALNIPLDTLKNEARFFDQDKTYITVCGKGGGRSMDGAKLLSDLNFKAFWLLGGTFGWFE